MMVDEEECETADAKQNRKNVKKCEDGTHHSEERGQKMKDENARHHSSLNYF